MSSSHITPGNPANGPTGPVFRAFEAVRHKLAANFHTPESWEREEDEQEAHAKSMGVDYKRTKMFPGTASHRGELMTEDEYDEFKSMLDSFKPPYKRRRKGAPRTTTRTRVRRDGNKGKSTITTRSRPGKKVEKQGIWPFKPQLSEEEQAWEAFLKANPSGYDEEGYDLEGRNSESHSREFAEPYKELSSHPSWAEDTAGISYPGTERVIEDRHQREVLEAYLAEKARGTDPARLAALAKLITHSGEDMNPDGIDWGSMSDEDIGRYHEAMQWAYGDKDYRWNTPSVEKKKMDKKSAVNDHAKMENLKEAAAATERGVLSPVLLQRAMEKQSDAWSDAINAVNEAMAGRGGSSPPPTLGSRVGAGVDTAVDALSDYWNRYVNAMKGGTFKDRLSDPGQARINQMLALTGTGALGGGVLGMLNEARKKEEDRDVLGGGFGGGVLGGLGGLGISAYGPNRLAKQTGLADHIKRPDWW